MVGGPSQMDLFDYKPVMNEWYDKDLPESVRMGQRLTTMTSRPGAVPDRAVEVSSSPSTASAACGSASCCRTRPRWSTTCASSAACTPRPSTTSRPSRYMQTGNQITGRPCLGLVGVVRPGLAEREPADVRRAGRQADATPSRCRRSPPGSGQSGYLPGEHAGVSFRTGGDPILYINNPPGVPDRRPPQDARRPARRSTR